MFGGRTNGGDALNDTWRLQIVPAADSFHYNWQQIFTNQPPSLVGRSRHSAVMLKDRKMMVYGGRQTNGQALSHVFLLQPSGLINSWNWTTTDLNPGGPNNPGARFGHTAVYDSVDRPGYSRSRILVFGGRTNTAMADSDLYALDVSNPLSPTWSKPTLVPGSAKPSARNGHSWALDPVRRGGPFTPADRRAVLFGGQTRLSPDTLSNQVWVLWISPSGDSIQWEQKTPSGAPTARTRHTAIWDQSKVPDPQHFDVMIVHGGDTGGAASNQVWELKDTHLGNGTWTQLTNSSQALSGQSANFAYQPYVALDPERFTPGTSSPGSWANENHKRLFQELYPQMFLLPSGNLFFAGPARGLNPNTLRYDGTAWSNLGTASSVHGLSAALLYRLNPNRAFIMKCGQYMDVAQGSTARISIDSTNAVTGWETNAAADTMRARVFHNLTVLPTGKVMVTGGARHAAQSDTISNPGVRQPEIWTPDATTGQWWTGRGVLAEDPARRAYHSTAVLLPDARVLSLGGDPPNAFRSIATLYCPPYLFNPGGSLAARPTIAMYHDTLGYNQSFTIQTEVADSIVNVCLIKPGAVTHAFNQDQRYVQLNYQVVARPPELGCPDKEIIASAPAHANVAPPGDYLLFIVKRSPFAGSEPVPSLAQWVRVRAGGNGPLIGSPPFPCGGGGCPIVDVKTESGWQVENTILGRSKDGSLATDVYRLKHAPSPGNGTLTVRIRESEQEVTTLDQARLVAVDHDPALRVFSTRDGFMLGERRPAFRVRRESGEEVTALVDGRGGRFQGQPGDVLLVDLYAPGEEVAPSGTMEPGGALEFDEKQGPAPGGGNSLKPNLGASPSAIDAAVLEGSGIHVQVPDGSNGWRTLEHRYPRERMDESVVAEGHRSLRLEFVGRHRLGFVGRMVPIGRASANDQPTRLVRHSRLGDVAKELNDIDGRTFTLIPGDAVELTCESSAVPEGHVRDYFLLTHGVYTALAPTADHVAGSVPLRFGLHQNRPNPFAGTTTIGFDIAQACQVRLEVFDLQGRRVRTLVSSRLLSGRHAVDWNHRSDRGDVVRAGTYVYRIIAGSFKEQRRMVLLP